MNNRPKHCVDRTDSEYVSLCAGNEEPLLEIIQLQGRNFLSGASLFPRRWFPLLGGPLRYA